MMEVMNVEQINIKGKRFTNWAIHPHDKGVILCVGDLLVSECDTLQQAIQDIIDIELEEPEQNA